MSANAKGDPVVSPWVYDSGPDWQGKRLRITVAFNNVTRVVTGAVVHRDPGCVYDHIYIGLGADGTPNSSTRVFAVPNLEGDRNINANALNSNGINVIEDLFLLGQITAGT